MTSIEKAQSRSKYLRHFQYPKIRFQCHYLRAGHWYNLSQYTLRKADSCAGWTWPSGCNWWRGYPVGNSHVFADLRACSICMRPIAIPGSEVEAGLRKAQRVCARMANIECLTIKFRLVCGTSTNSNCSLLSGNLRFPVVRDRAES